MEVSCSSQLYLILFGGALIFSFSPYHSNLQCFAALLLEVALRRIVPGSVVLNRAMHPLGALVDVSLPYPPHVGFLETLERTVADLIKERTPLRYFSMLRTNALVMAHHRGMELLGEQLQQQAREMVDLVELGDQILVCDALPFTTTGEGGCVRIVAATRCDGSASEDLHRFVIVAREDARAMKAWKRNWSALCKKTGHEVKGTQSSLFALDRACNPLWLEHGILLKAKAEEKMRLTHPLPQVETRSFGHPSCDVIARHLLARESVPKIDQFWEWDVSSCQERTAGRGILPPTSITSDVATRFVSLAALPNHIREQREIVEARIAQTFGVGRWILFLPRGCSREMQHVFSTESENISSRFPSEVRRIDAEHQRPHWQLFVEDALATLWPVSWISASRLARCVACHSSVLGSVETWIALELERSGELLPFCP